MCVLFMRGAGPVGYPGGAEVVNMRPPSYLIKKGVTALACIGDGRQSGTSGSPSILNASPEAATGGGLAILKTGDRVRIDLNKRTADILISKEEYDKRRAALQGHGGYKYPGHQTPWQGDPARHRRRLRARHGAEAGGQIPEDRQDQRASRATIISKRACCTTKPVARPRPARPTAKPVPTSAPARVQARATRGLPRGILLTREHRGRTRPELDRLAERSSSCFQAGDEAVAFLSAHFGRNSWSKECCASLGRAFLILEHGTGKYLNFPVGPMNSAASPLTPGGAAGLIELVAGVLLAIPVFFTRPSAFILSGTMAVAYFYAHAPRVLHQSSIRANWRWSTASSFFTWPPPAVGLWSLDRLVRHEADSELPNRRWQEPRLRRRSQGKDEAGGGAMRQRGPVGVEDLTLRRARTPSDMERTHGLPRGSVRSSR